MTRQPTLQKGQTVSPLAVTAIRPPARSSALGASAPVGVETYNQRSQDMTAQIARCIQTALNDAGIDPTEVQYVNAHGTSTQLGDLGEVKAAKKVFADHAYKLAMSSTKSTTGHLLGAAGGVEAIFSILALRDQVLPPTINLDEPGEGCDLDFVPNTAREAKLDVAISNSFGFGGTNGTLVFRRV